jgi:hypothetical protein
MIISKNVNLLEFKLHKKISSRRQTTEFFSVVSVTCRSSLIHVEVDSMFQPPLYQESTWFKGLTAGVVKATGWGAPT